MIRMEGIKGGGARVGAGEDDMGDGMQCVDHPHRNNPGGICAFCLQEKLGKLVSSSFPLPIRPSSSSSSSSSSPPSFRSDMAPSASAAPSSSNLSFSARPVSSVKNGAADSQYDQYCNRRARLPYLLAKMKKKASSNFSSSSAAPPSGSDNIFKRSKSSATPRTRRGKFLNDAEDDIVIENFNPRRRNGFWSFLYLPSKPSASTRKSDSKSFRDNRNSPRISTIAPVIAGSSSVKQKDKFLGSNLGRKIDIGGEEDDSPHSLTTASVSSFERKVSRSRSVGCGSRSFSGDFFERISTGLGDCTLRRVESQREGKSKAVAASSIINHHQQCMKERVKCGGIFNGLMMTSSSSSSSSSSYRGSSCADDHVNGKSAAAAISHGRARSWGWAFASPMRAFSTKSKRDIIRDASEHKNATAPKPNLSDIPSLLAVGV